MAQYDFTEKNGVQQGMFYFYDASSGGIGEYQLILGCKEDGYTILSARDKYDWHYIDKGDKVFTTRQELEEFVTKIKVEREKEETRRAKQKEKHDAMVDTYFEKKGRLKASDFVRMIKENFCSQQQLSYIVTQLRPEPEPFEYYRRAFAMLKNGYVDYVCNNNVRGRCYFKNVDYAELEPTSKKDKKGDTEYRIVLYKGKDVIFSTTCQDLVIPLRMIFTNYEWNDDWRSRGWRNNADCMNTLPKGNN